jgi:glyceraldehyde 3-phosphate dehydrogenase
MINIGINGLGRIGKCVFLQLIHNPKFNIKCINVLDVSITEIEDYLKYDSSHKYNIDFSFHIISDTECKINEHIIKYVSDRNAKNINWKEFGCEYLIDATGVHLTTEKCLNHNVDYVIISAPPKDNTPSFVFGANHEKYNGEKIIAGSSCTTNCISPILKLLNDEYKINNCNFTTIHATTATQNTVDIINKSNRTNRSILNNIIPHTTGASSAVVNIIPELANKIYGTSVRVPVLYCSLLDLNIELENKNVVVDDIKNLILQNKHFKSVFDINEKQLVSCDFRTTTTPTILDVAASMDMNSRMKLMVWYDNEWSYSAQLIRLVESMYSFNNKIKSKYYFENINMVNQGVVCRLDFNVPVENVNDNNEIIDDFRIVSSLKTIETILSNNPKYLILTSHFGRPKDRETKFSLEFLIPVLEKYLKKTVKFLKNGIDTLTLTELKTNPSGIYLLENIRFHEEETNYAHIEKMESTEKLKLEQFIDTYKQFGDVFICDAFGCVHREHMSICAMKNFNKSYGYGHLIRKEVDIIDSLINNSDKKILSIIGGNKINDKLPIINSLKQIKNSTVYVAGGLSRQYKETHGNVLKMKDGYGHINLNMVKPIYIENIENIENNDLNIYDIGRQSLNDLFELIKEVDIIFWNGPLGVIEHESYKSGSIELMNHLNNLINKTIIIGGGETATLIDETTKMHVSTGGGALLEYLQSKIITGKNIIGLNAFV